MTDIADAHAPAPSHPPPVQVPAAPDRPALIHRLGPAIALTALAFGIRRMIWALNRIPNSPEEFERHGGWMCFAIAALGIILIVGSMREPAWPPLARASRFSRRALAAALLCWWLPVPFFFLRIVSLILLYIIAAVYLLAVLQAVIASPRRGPIPPSAPWWAAAGASAAVLASLLADKYQSLGFSTAID